MPMNEVESAAMKKWLSTRVRGEKLQGMDKGQGHSPRDMEYTRVDFPWHSTKTCDVYFQYQNTKVVPLCKAFWCATHGQWTYVMPIKIITEY